MAIPELESRHDEVSALYRIAAIGAREGDLNLAIKEGLRAVSDIIPSERAVLFIHDEEKDDLRSFAGTGEEEERLSLNEPGIVRRVFLSGRAEFVNDVPSDRDVSPTMQDVYRTRTIALAPLILGDVRLGVIAAINSIRGAFTAGDLKLLSALADRVAVSVRLGQLNASVSRQSRELEGLQRLTGLLESQESLDFVIGESVRIVTDLVECQKLMVLLFDEDTAKLRLEHPAHGIDESFGELEIPIAEASLASTVFRTSTPMISNDAANDAWVARWLREKLDISNALCVPLVTDVAPMGVLEAINSEKGAFDEEDLRFVTLLGSRIGGVIELSRSRVRERKLMQKLQEADRAKSDFVSMLAHELKGPMTTIMGFGQALHQTWDSLPEEKRGHYLEVVYKETERLSHMVSDLLDMSRMDSGTLRYEMERMSVPELVENILAIHTSLTAQHGVKVEIPAGLPDTFADRERVRQVLMNLLTNATRYSPEGTTITIRARVIQGDEQRWLRVAVTDEGIGIAPEDADRIFNKFAMLPKPAWTKKGTGLGLFISRNIVEAHGGRMWVESELGQGTTFFFTLPVATQGLE